LELFGDLIVNDDEQSESKTGIIMWIMILPRSPNLEMSG